MVHAIEAFTSRHRKNPLSDGLARQALALLSATSGRVSQRRNREGAWNMLLGSMLAGMAFANAPVAAVHALAYPIGAIFHVPHGLSNALVLMGVLRFNLPGRGDALRRTRRDARSGRARSARSGGGGALRRRDGGDLPGLRGARRPRRGRGGGGRSRAPRRGRDEADPALVNNPREVAFADALAIYREAYAGEAGRPA
jgi:alcohol dehydrogenase class IV